MESILAEETVAVGVIVEKRKALNPWIDHTWVAVAVVPGMPEAAPLTPIDRSGEVETFYLGAALLVFTSSETANYRDNLVSGDPKLWVVMRIEDEEGIPSLLTVTADPSEGEAHTEAGSNLVDVVPMAPEIAAFLAAFVDEHHVEHEFFKRKRDRADPERFGRRRPGEGGAR